MIGPQDVRLNFSSLAGADKGRLIGVSVRKKYDKTTNQRTDEVEGINYEVLLEKQGFNKCIIKTMNKVAVIEDDVVKASEEAIYITFSDDMEARFFKMDGKWLLSAKASSAELVKSNVAKGK